MSARERQSSENAQAVNVTDASHRSKSNIRLALVGAGGMGMHQIGMFGKLDGCEIVAVCDVDKAQAEKAAKLAGPGTAVFTDLDHLFEQTEFDGVLNCTPDRFHHPVALRALRSGKHILSEKPLALNYREAQEMVEAAAEAGVVNMVNFSYRDAPAIQKAREIVSSGQIGRVIHIEASYMQSWLSSKVWGDWRTSPAWLWRLSTEHGSQGTLGDIGVHILDFASFPVGAYKSVRCELRTFEKAPDDRIGEYVLDANDSVVISADFKNGAFGVLQASRWATGYRNRVALQVFGDEGAVRVDLDKDRNAVDVCVGKDIDKSLWKTVAAPQTPNNYERFLSSIRSGVIEQPTFARGAEIQRVLDACFESDASGTAIDC
jgi:predicted dehydrogenase